ncbi:LTA synthase family protein [Peribacillus sp. B-H-3]|uniref:LTA synthase family protein n=1 Tax=Peribacillus sp. B-H-3 TaxID=3400420 RepID=UPI003B01A896
MSNQKTFIGIFTYLSLIIKFSIASYIMMGSFHIQGFFMESALLLMLFFMLYWMNHRPFTAACFLTNFILSLIVVIQLMYFDYYSSILTYKSLAQVNQAGKISESIIALTRISYLLFFADLLGVLLYKFLNGPTITFPKLFSEKIMHILLILGFSYAVFGLVSSSKTISELHQYDQLGFLGFQLLTAVQDARHVISEENIVTADSLANEKQGILERKIRYKGIANGKNLIIVQLESVQNFLINLSIGGREVTPNLNAFLKESFYFPHFYTQVGKGNTSDAEFITNTSLYAKGDIPMSAAAEGKKVPGMPRVLGENGYHTATFHANSVTFWNREKLYASLGFQDFFDKNYFGGQDPISYGVSDEVMYKKTVKKLAAFHHDGEKFYSHIIALSSHFPYKLPEEKKKYAITLPKEYEGSMVGSYIEAVSYADYAFGRFIKELKNEGLYNQSVIAVYGDHQGLQTKSSKDEKLAGNIFRNKYDPVLDHLNIPLIIKVPSINQGATINMTGGLVDIYPTVANLLGIDISKEVIFGTDLINAASNVIGIRFYAPTGTYITESSSFSPGANEKSGIKTNINSRATSPADKNSIKELHHLIHYLRLSDDFVDSLPSLQ